jgi:hypothetical protein
MSDSPAVLQKSPRASPKYHPPSPTTPLLRRGSIASHRPFSFVGRCLELHQRSCSHVTPHRSAPVMGSNVAKPHRHWIRRPPCCSGSACWPGAALHSPQPLSALNLCGQLRKQRKAE